MYDTYGSYYSTTSPYSAREPASSSNDFGAVMGILAGLGVLWVVIIAIAIFLCVAMWKIFKKANVDGYESLIPGHNQFVMLKLAGLKGYYFFLLLLGCIPFVGWIIAIGIGIWWSIEFAKAFGKGAGFGVGLALLPVIFYPILAFGSAQYIGPQANNNSNNYQNPNNFGNNSYNNVNPQNNVYTNQNVGPQNYYGVQQPVANEPAIPVEQPVARPVEQQPINNVVNNPVEPVKPVEPQAPVSPEPTNTVSNPTVNTEAPQANDPANGFNFNNPNNQ